MSLLPIRNPQNKAYLNKMMDRVIYGSISKVSASKKLGISRKTLYQWIREYKSNSISKNTIIKEVLKLVSKNPNFGPKKISAILSKNGKKVSLRAVWLILRKSNLNLKEKRVDYAYNYRKNSNILNPEARKRIVEAKINRNKSTTELCIEFNLSRKTLSKWIKRYRLAKNNNLNLLSAMKDQYKLGEAHPRGLKTSAIDSILSFVVANPNFSTHKISQSLGFVGNHGVQNVLSRYGLNKVEYRLSYASKHQIAPVEAVQEKTDFAHGLVNNFTNFLTPNLSPAPPPLDLFKITLGTTLISSIFFFLLLQVNSFGMFFATTALLTGSFFFVYSLKYYLTLGLVLSYSQEEKNKSSSANFISWVLGGNKNSTIDRQIQSIGLNPDMDSVILKKKPFVSVHIALFNEKNVVERIAKAVTNFDYPAYEVILADDSTDETSDKITKFQEQFLYKGEKLKQVKGDGWIISSVEIRPNCFLKHIHRTSRDGFKGKALDLALELTDQKAEYISIFDADFVPYPDSLQLFLKYFQSADNPKVAAVQGYQWHVLNKSENWITRGVRSEYSGSYVIERSGAEIYGGLKQISGSVYMIKKSALAEIGWGTSITEDFELTLKLYEAGYKVLYTPYVQAPAECVSTLRRLIRQRMRWAEGHSFNVKKMFTKLMSSPNLTKAEKLEFLYLTPYYLQAFFFLMGTFSWLISETVFKTKLPFWTETWGWSLVLTNMISLPLLNAVGLFMEESEKKDYSGIWGFIALSYIVVPFQAYAAVKGFLEKEEGPWFRTPKTGRITDLFTRGRFMRFVQDLMPNSSQGVVEDRYLALTSANSQFSNFNIKKRSHQKWFGKAFLSVMLAISVTLTSFAPTINNLAPANAQAFGNTIESGDKVDTIPDDYLALNTNKTVYGLGETVKISMADINYLGETVCDAQIKVTITNSLGEQSILSSTNGTVKVNQKYCQDKKILTIDPDYEARFETMVEGLHTISMEATRHGETYKVFDSFEVKKDVGVDIRRMSATRIYPKNIYPMIIIVKPSMDYKGLVTESLPKNFDVFEAGTAEIKKFLPIKQGANIATGITRNLQRIVVGERQLLSWEVDWKKGNEYLISYFYDTPDKSPDLYDVGKFKIGSIFEETAFWNLAIDTSGSGTNTVTPTVTTAGATDQTFTFTYDPSETFTYGGEIRIKVPNSSSWSAPQGTGGTAGYTTASVTGTGVIGTVLNNADSATGWGLTGGTTGDFCETASGLDTSVFVEGSGSIICNDPDTDSDSGDAIRYDYGSGQDWSSYTTVGYWVRSSQTEATPNAYFAWNNDADLHTTIIGSDAIPALTANTWLYEVATLSGTRTSIRSFGVACSSNTCSISDSQIFYIDDFVIGPGLPTFPANGSDTDIALRFITLDTNATVTVTYGSGGGTSGADVPSTVGSYEFTTRSRVATSTSLDSLANISAHPSITVSAYNTAHSFQRKTWYDGTRYWRAYHDSADARIEFEYSSDGSSWTEDTSARISTSTYDFSVWGNSSNAFIVYTNGYDIESRKASSYPGTGFSWGSATVVYNGSGVLDYYQYPTISADSNSKLWIATKVYNQGSISSQQIASADDDAADIAGDSNFHTTGVPTTWTGTNLATGGKSAAGNAVTTGYRFTNITIPQGAIISNATFDLRNMFVNSPNGYGTNVKTNIKGALVSDIATFSNSNLPRSITTTSASVTWDSANEDLSSGQWFSETLSNTIPAITSVVQEIVDQSGWASGNDLGIIVVDDGSTNDWWWEPSDYESSSANSAKLSLSYSLTGITTVQSTSANDISAWGTATTLNSSSNSNQYPVIVPRTSGAMQAIWMDGTGIESKNYNGTSWDSSSTSVATGVSGLTTSISAVADSSGNVHLLYINNSNNTVYKEYTSSWQTAVTLDSNSGNAYPSISIDTTANDLYAFWIRSDDIFYKKGVSDYTSGNWDTSATSWQTTGTLTWISSVYSYNAPSFAVWTTGSGTPPIDWDIIAVPELMWLFFGFAPLMPLLSKLKRKKIYERF